MTILTKISPDHLTLIDRSIASLPISLPPTTCFVAVFFAAVFAVAVAVVFFIHSCFFFNRLPRHLHTNKMKFKYKHNHEEHLVCAVSNHGGLPYVNKVISKLAKYGNVMELFSTGVFKQFLAAPNSSTICAPMLLAFLQRQVEVEGAREDDLYFRIGERLHRFGRQEFLLITGLRFGRIDPLMLEGQNVKKDGVLYRIFDGNIPQYKEVYHILDGEDNKLSPTDAVKLVYAILTVHILRGNDDRGRVPAFVWELLDDLDAFNAFPWGTYSYGHLRNALQKVIKPSMAKRVQIYGFSWVFQWWIVEHFPFLRVVAGANMQKGPAQCPRMMNWLGFHSAKRNTSWHNLLDMAGKNVVEATLEPTKEEKQTGYWASFDPRRVIGVQEHIKGVYEADDKLLEGVDTEQEEEEEEDKQEEEKGEEGEDEEVGEDKEKHEEEEEEEGRTRRIESHSKKVHDKRVGEEFKDIKDMFSKMMKKLDTVIEGQKKLELRMTAVETQLKTMSSHMKESVAGLSGKRKAQDDPVNRPSTKKTVVEDVGKESIGASPRKASPPIEEHEVVETSDLRDEYKKYLSSKVTIYRTTGYLVQFTQADLAMVTNKDSDTEGLHIDNYIVALRTKMRENPAMYPLREKIAICETRGHGAYQAFKPLALGEEGHTPWFDVNDVLVPTLVGGCHWVLCRILLDTKTIVIYDPMAKTEDDVRFTQLALFKDTVNRLVKEIDYYGKTNKQTPRDNNGKDLSWKLSRLSVDRVPQQPDGSSCGPYVCMYIEQIMRGVSDKWEPVWDANKPHTVDTAVQIRDNMAFTIFSYSREAD